MKRTRASQRPRALRPVTAPMTVVDRDNAPPDPPGATGHSWQRPRPLRRPPATDGVVEPIDPPAED